MATVVVNAHGGTSSTIFTILEAVSNKSTVVVLSTNQSPGKVDLTTSAMDRALEERDANTLYWNRLPYRDEVVRSSFASSLSDEVARRKESIFTRHKLHEKQIRKNNKAYKAPSIPYYGGYTSKDNPNRAKRKLGKNDLCFCSSGLKFKYCCMKNK